LSPWRPAERSGSGRGAGWPDLREGPWAGWSRPSCGCRALAGKSAERPRLPGCSAMPEGGSGGIAQAILDSRTAAVLFALHNITEEEQCSICSDAKRDSSGHLLVEEPSNIPDSGKSAAIAAPIMPSRRHCAPGRHRPEDLTIDGLMDRASVGQGQEGHHPPRIPRSRARPRRSICPRSSNRSASA